MTIHRQGSYLRYMECEDCPETVGEDDGYKFNELIEIAKAKGWSIEKNRDDWEHRCPDCSKTSRLDRQMRLFS